MIPSLVSIHPFFSIFPLFFSRSRILSLSLSLPFFRIISLVFLNLRFDDNFGKIVIKNVVKVIMTTILSRNTLLAHESLTRGFWSFINRYIEIFRSSLSEVRASIGPKMRGGPMGGFNQRPAPYTRGDRFGGMNRFSNNGRGSRNRGDYFFVSSEFHFFET